MNLKLALLIKENCQLGPYIGVIQDRNITTDLLILEKGLAVKFHQSCKERFKLIRTIWPEPLILIVSFFYDIPRCWKLPQSLKTHVDETIKVAVFVKSAKLFYQK